MRCVPSRKLTYPPKNGILKMIFLFPRWDMLIPWCVHLSFEDWLVIPGVGEAAFDSGIATDIFGGATNC